MKLKVGKYYMSQHMGQKRYWQILTETENRVFLKRYPPFLGAHCDKSEGCQFQQFNCTPAHCCQAKCNFLHEADEPVVKVTGLLYCGTLEDNLEEVRK